MFDLVPFRRRNEEDWFGQMLKSFHDVVDDNWFSPFQGSAQSFRTDITEKDDKYVVHAELPGVAKEDIDISVNDHYLTIRAKRNEVLEQTDDSKQVIRKERRTGEFVRSFYVDNIQEDSIKAKLQDGVLQLEIPKRPDRNDLMRRIHIE